MNNDSRCRYYHSISINNNIIWSGYLLHEEAWTIIQKMSVNNPLVSFVCYENKISNVSDKYNELNL